MKRAIILAAGKGTRLYPITENIPKCLVKIKNKSILERQIEVFKDSGFKEIIVVTGYKNDKIKNSEILKVYNERFDETNMLYSLLCAEEYMNDDIIISYGDIIFKKSVLDKLINSKEEITVVSDSLWFDYWRERFDDPLDDAESFIKKNENEIESLGEKVKDISKIQGQYIGLIKLSKLGCNIIKKTYNDADLNNKNIWNSKKNIEKTFMTDILNYLSKTDQVNFVEIKRNWFEIDSIKDLEIANKNNTWIDEK